MIVSEHPLVLVQVIECGVVLFVGGGYGVWRHECGEQDKELLFSGIHSMSK